MASRIILGGRVWMKSPNHPPPTPRWARPQKFETGPNTYILLPANAVITAEGKLRDIHPIAPDAPQSPFREGVPFTDPEDGLTYRVVRVLDGAEGWASSAWWQDRWKVDHACILEMVDRGYLDPAIEFGSKAKRYRCRDEHRVRASKEWKEGRARVTALELDNPNRKPRKAVAAKPKAKAAPKVKA